MKQIIEIKIEREVPKEFVSEIINGSKKFRASMNTISENAIREVLFDNTDLLSSDLKTVKSYLVDDNGKEVV